MTIPSAQTILEQLNAIAPAVENLARHQEQCDMDGVMVKVSRQALDEVLNAVNNIAIDLSGGEAVAVRECLVGNESLRNEVQRYIFDGTVRNISPYDTATSILLYLSAALPSEAIGREIDQHVAWLNQYIFGMNDDNWRDMKMRAERQITQLASAFSRPHQHTGESK